MILHVVQTRYSFILYLVLGMYFSEKRQRTPRKARLLAKEKTIINRTHNFRMMSPENK